MLVYQSSYKKRFQNAKFCYFAAITTNFSASTAERDITKLAGREVINRWVGVTIHPALLYERVDIYFHVISLYAAFQKSNETLCKQISWVYFVVFHFTTIFRLLYLLP